MVLLGTATFATNDGITSLEIVSDFAGTGSINTSRNDTTIVKINTGYKASFSGSLRTPGSSNLTYQASFTVTTSGSGTIQIDIKTYSILFRFSNLITYISITNSSSGKLTLIDGLLTKTSKDNWIYRRSTTTLASLTITYTQDTNVNQAILTINSADSVSSKAKELFEFGCVFGAIGALDPLNPKGEAGSFDENTAIGGLLILILSIVSLTNLQSA